MFVRAGRLNMYRPDGALIGTLAAFACGPSGPVSVPTGQKTQQRIAREDSERHRLAAIYTDEWSAWYRKSVSLRASFSRVTIFTAWRVAVTKEI